MVFISYRRTDAKSTAQLLKKSLVEKGFEKNDIFLDLHDIVVEDFTEVCREAISECDSFVLIISNNSFTPKEGNDYYFDEIQQALDENKKIIPIICNAEFDEKIIPQAFKEKNLHKKHAIRYDAEFHEASINKIIAAITKGQSVSLLNKLSKWFVVPLVFITIYLTVSLVGGVIRYIWDNYWLSENTCYKYASQHIVSGEDSCYYYKTSECIYKYNPRNQKIDMLDFNNINDEAINIAITKSDAIESGFWTLAVGMVYEISKMKVKKYGNAKTTGVIIATTISVVAGFGFGFTIERMIFPVYECKIITDQLESSPEWWEKVIEMNEKRHSVNYSF